MKMFVFRSKHFEIGQMSIDGELVKQSRMHSFRLQPLCQAIVPESNELQ